jgi:hypothetical protein
MAFQNSQSTNLNLLAVFLLLRLYIVLNPTNQLVNEMLFDQFFKMKEPQHKPKRDPLDHFLYRNQASNTSARRLTCACLHRNM